MSEEATNPIAANLPQWVCLESFVDHICRNLTEESLIELCQCAIFWCSTRFAPDTEFTLRETVDIYMEEKLLERGYYLVYRDSMGPWTVDELNGKF